MEGVTKIGKIKTQTTEEPRRKTCGNDPRYVKQTVLLLKLVDRYTIWDPGVYEGSKNVKETQRRWIYMPLQSAGSQTTR